MVEEFLKETYGLFGNKEIDMDLKFREDLNATSLQYIGMAATIEDLTGKAVSYAQIRGCATLRDAVELLKSLS